MLNLLKADFYRILKSKITLVSLILAIILPIGTVLLYYGVKKVSEESTVEGMEMLNLMFSGRGMIASSFSLSSNFGIIVPIFGAIFVSGDLKNGTLRNKIIIGHNRKSIFLSHLITTIAYYFVIMLIYVGLTALLSCLIFGYGMEVDVKELFYVLIIGFGSFLLVATIATFFNLLIESTPLAIVLTVVCSLGLSLISAILAAIDNEKYLNLIYFIPLYANTTMGTGTLTNQIFTEGIISIAVFSAINVVLGMYIFVKRDLK